MYNSTKDDVKATAASEDAHKPLMETVVEGVEGIDEPMEDEHPSVPAWLALGVYPITLVVALVAGLLFFFLFR
jgi:hypothetical protein